LRPPHRFPFELIDRESADRARTAPTVSSWWLRGASPMTLPLLVEATAQAAARLLAPSETHGSAGLALAGIESAELFVPPVAGDGLAIEVRLVARLGGVVRVAGTVSRSEAEVARVVLTLASA